MESLPANEILFSDLCTLLEKLTKKKKHRQDQDNILNNFINEFSIRCGKIAGKKNTTFFPILRLLLPDKDRERNPYNLKETKLGALLVKVLSLNKQSHDAQELLNFRSVQNSFHETDFAGIAYFVLRNRMTQKMGRLTIKDINNLLDKIATIDVGNRGLILDEAFSFAIKNLSADQLKWFLRIILKDLKLSMSTQRILSAFHPDAPELYESCSSLSKVCEDLGEGDTRPIELGVQIFFAVRPMLSERLDITKITNLLSSEKTYHIENKFDGERFQVHMEAGVFEYFSRKGFTYAKNYGKTYESGLLTPYLNRCFQPNVTSFILDGEMMGWHKENEYFGSKGMAFDIKKVTENSKFRPCFCAFDILYYNGQSLIGPAEKGGKPLKERLQILDSIFVDIPGVIVHSNREVVKDSKDVLDALNKAIENQDEGVVLKDVNSYYIANRRNAGWYKIKPEYTEGTMTDLDLVIIGANEAENKRQGRAESFHVACVDTAADEKRWLAVGRVYSGLSFEERERVCAHLEKHWQLAKKKPIPPCLYFNKDKPDLWILPEYSIVLEVRATELVRSSSSGTEYTLRFPRVMKVRSDKPVEDILNVEEFQKLVAERNAVIKLSTKRINESQIDDQTANKMRRTRMPKVYQVAEKFRTKPTGNVEVISNALHEREICILSDDEDCKKTELIKIVESHGGKHVENPGPKTWCCVVGTLTFRVRNLIKSNVYDVISTSWLRSLPKSEKPCPIYPIDMLSIKQDTKLKLAIDYDAFGDSYKEELDEETLKKCLKKMDNEDPIYLTKSEMLYLDRELFGATNPFSFLRSCSILFVHDSMRSILAKIYGANICSTNNNVTHVVLQKGHNNDQSGINHIGSAKVVFEEWLDKCFEQKALVSESEYLVNKMS